VSRKRPKTNATENRLVSALDNLAEFEAFQDDVLPLLRQAIKEGWTREQIENHPKVEALIAARQLTIALREADSGKAMTAIKDFRDRKQGKAKESQEVTHKLEKLPDEQLDSLLLSKLKEMGSDDEDDEMYEPLPS
jgi:predicted RNA-binding protein